ncbi:hypothetical protein NLU13_0820 [Sarocladium strictum]|uniref:G-protein coupled receptors family 2 profile 2 domain-containing protein n=1 Tax=Sarocladium strictum TaxID=5046 RepID=A0AA39GQI7_SARSR|nr:hypothetical protein NLU13_0820 [Sarocladium strictum]
MDEAFLEHQLHIIVYLERIGGSISLIAVFLIFIAYALVPRTRNVQNTFIVFASVSNIGASVASIIALDGLQAGKETALCQAQSFLFEMFMQSDPWWSLAMAINVFLVFFFRTSPDSFRRWWWVYCLICYGGPFIIALSLLFVRQQGRGPVYGGATIWCWVDREWDDIRIYTYYMLIWVCIAGSILFYSMVGYHVFHTRNQLRSLSTSKNRDADLPPLPSDGFYGTAITEIQVTHSSLPVQSLPPSTPKRAHASNASHVSFEEDCSPPPNPSATRTYYSSVTSSAPPLSKKRGSSRSPSSTLSRSKRAFKKTVGKFGIDDPIKRAYLRTSVLFALSVLVTWIPSSLNRIHSWLQGESPFEYHVATAAVLPLQGLWNAVIFFVTSGTALKAAWFAFWAKDSGGMAQDDGGNVDSDHYEYGQRRRQRGHGEFDSDMDDGDSGVAGSDIELRHMVDPPGKRSESV